MNRGAEITHVASEDFIEAGVARAPRRPWTSSRALPCWDFRIWFLTLPPIADQSSVARIAARSSRSRYLLVETGRRLFVVLC